MAQWEMCCVASVGWHHYISHLKLDYKSVLYYFTPTGVITRFPSINSWGQVFAILGTAEWEPINVQHGLAVPGSDTGWGGRLRGIYVDHPSGDKQWIFDSCDMLAYFKRPVQAGRKIDDAL